MHPVDVRAEEKRSVEILSGEAALLGDLRRPAAAKGLVVFAHGSGSSRSSPRNQAVARTLERAGLATFLLDLLTEEEEQRDLAGAMLRFDVERLSARLLSAVDGLAQEPGTRALPLGIFGASTGAAVALVVASRRPGRIRAVVSRGGRPDLARGALELVACPTRLIVGGADPVVLELNREALARLRCAKELVVVPGATHLFEEPGALDEVARIACEWFVRHVPAPSLEGLERQRGDLEC
jgi:pimeloyl-ACP methyl ester carboxylesterase